MDGDTERQDHIPGLTSEIREQIENLPNEGYICVAGKTGPYIVSVKETKDWCLNYTPDEGASDTEPTEDVPAVATAPWLLKQTIVAEEEASSWLAQAEQNRV